MWAAHVCSSSLLHAHRLDSFCSDAAEAEALCPAASEPPCAVGTDMLMPCILAALPAAKRFVRTCTHRVATC